MFKSITSLITKEQAMFKRSLDCPIVGSLLVALALGPTTTHAAQEEKIVMYLRQSRRLEL